VELVGRNIAPLHFKTEKPTPHYANRDVEQLWLDFPELGGYFPVPGSVN